MPRSTKVLIISRAPVWTPGLYAELKRFRARGGTIAVLDALSLSRAAQRTADAITITGPDPADVAALKPIWTISGTATAFSRPPNG